ncbi:MAG: hypothetical protein OEX82_08600 [Nitrosomonas sp.]|nr:hypothetical protein [Nitrosomonas sp.]
MLNKLQLIFIGLLLSFTVQAADINQGLLTVEIEGVSLSTPIDAIPGILESHGYNQVSSTTYTRRSPADGQRMSIHRIEITDTTDLRQISYIREKSGGRIKSPPKIEEPILDSELGTAQTIYRIVCDEVSVQDQDERLCQPATASNIIFNQGNVLKISSSLEASLNASAASTIIRLKYSEK